MAETRTENEGATWSVSQCAFTIEYSLRAIDDIRLAVVDAFFSLPRGGAEIGGILLGTYESRRLTISHHVPVPCEHATGPSFVLSPKDHTKLAELMASARGNPGGTYPVGWYHSHTRSDIFLSTADLDIHRRYFPEPWQVALVLKPHTFQPTRAGFFFRESDGVMRATASYKEFILEPLAVRPHANAVAASVPVPEQRRRPEPAEPRNTVAAEPPPVARPVVNMPVSQEIQRIEVVTPPLVENRLPEAETRIQIEPIEIAPPNFTQVAPTRSKRWMGILAAVMASLALGATAYQTRDSWLPQILAWVHPMPAPIQRPFIGLSTLDTDGQLQIRWDRNSPAVHDANGATLVIVDGPSQQAILLDPAHLQLGSFTYGRQNERVDVTLTVRGSANQSTKEVATYLGKLPDRKAPEGAGTNKERESLVKELETQRSRTKKLEKSVEDMRTELRKDAKRKRLGNQSPDTVK